MKHKILFLLFLLIIPISFAVDIELSFNDLTYQELNNSNQNLNYFSSVTQYNSLICVSDNNEYIDSICFYVVDDAADTIIDATADWFIIEDNILKLNNQKYTTSNYLVWEIKLSQRMYLNNNTGFEMTANNTQNQVGTWWWHRIFFANENDEYCTYGYDDEVRAEGSYDARYRICGVTDIDTLNITIYQYSESLKTNKTDTNINVKFTAINESEVSTDYIYFTSLWGGASNPDNIDYTSFKITGINDNANQLPNLTLSINDSVKCINESLTETVQYDIEITVNDDEGDTIYYAESTQGNILNDEILFATDYNTDLNYYTYGNDYVMPVQWNNQSWGYGLDRLRLTGNFSEYNGVLYFNKDTFPSSLNSDYYGITYSLNQFYDDDPRIIWANWLNDGSEFEIELYNGLLEKIHTITLNQTGLTSQDTNMTLRINEQETNIILNQTYPYFHYYMVNFSDNEINLYYCNEGQGCSPNSFNQYTLINTTVNDELDVNYIQFNVIDGAAFMDQLFFSYEQYSVFDWTTTQPDSITADFIGCYDYVLYVTDSIHLDSTYVKESVPYCVRQCELFTDDILDDDFIGGWINPLKDGMIKVANLLGNNSVKSALWMLWVIIFITGIVTQFKITHEIKLGSPMLVASVMMFFPAWLLNYNGHSVTFIILSAFVLARPLIINMMDK